MHPSVFAKFRTRYGLTRKRLAADLGVNQSTLFRWEEGITKPPSKLVFLALQSIARHYQGLEAALRAPLQSEEPAQESLQMPQKRR